MKLNARIAVRSAGGEHAEWDRHGDRDDLGEHHHLEGDREPLADRPHHGLVVQGVGLTEVAVQHAPEPVHGTNGQWFVQAELAASPRTTSALWS